MLSVKGLWTHYHAAGGNVPAVRGIDLEIGAGTSLALVGESGSGKSTAALSIMRLIRPPIGDVTDGVVELGGRDLLRLRESEMRSVLRHQIGYIPQDPTTALDPLFSIRTQIRQVLNDDGDRKAREELIVNLLDRLGVAKARERLKSYPHEFSGGMRQRVAIAIALAKRPELLIADEPTTALDVTTQLAILKLLDELRRERKLAVIFVTHDLAVARLVCQQVAVMYAGVIVETGPIESVLRTPRHPYTQALLDADPGSAPPRTKLRAIAGQPPVLNALPVGCPFAPRCPHAEDRCTTELPAMERRGEVQVRCIKTDEVIRTTVSSGVEGGR